MFTAENFRRIYDAENRKGLDLANRYFPSLEPLTLAVRTKVQDIRDHRAPRRQNTKATTDMIQSIFRTGPAIAFEAFGSTRP